MSVDTIRIRVAPDVYAELQQRADERGLALGELVKRAVALYRYLEIDHDGGLAAATEGEARRRMLGEGR